MSGNNRSVAMGAFIVGALLVLAVVLLYLTGSGFGQRDKIVMVFNGSVKGLNVGAPVALRGVQVGQVTDVKVIIDTRSIELIMLVEAEMQDSAINIQGGDNENLTAELLDRGLRAQLQNQSLLTGLLYIQLDFFPGTDIRLADIESPYVQLPTVPTDLEKIANALQALDIQAIVDDINSISTAVNDLMASEEIVAIPQSFNATLVSLQQLSDQLSTQLDSTGPKLDEFLVESAGTMSSANSQLPATFDKIQANLDGLSDAIAAFEGTMGDVDNLVSQDSKTIYQINKALEEVSRASRSLQSLALTIEQQPEALVRGKSGGSQ